MKSPDVWRFLWPDSSDVSLVWWSLGVGVVVFMGASAVDYYLLAHGYSADSMIFGSDAFGGVLAFVLFLAYLRAARARNRYLRQRLETVAGLNHNVRNALAAISLSNYLVRPPEVEIIRDGVERIERALNEFVPVEIPEGRELGKGE